MSAPKITVAMIAAPCVPSACHGVETGHAMRQPAFIARPAPAPYSAPVIVGRIASEFRNIRLNNRTRIPPPTVLPIPQAKPMSHGLTRRSSLTIGGTRRTGSLAGLVEKVSRLINTTTKDAARAADRRRFRKSTSACRFPARHHQTQASAARLLLFRRAVTQVRFGERRMKAVEILAPRLQQHCNYHARQCNLC